MTILPDGLEGLSKRYSSDTGLAVPCRLAGVEPSSPQGWSPEAVQRLADFSISGLTCKIDDITRNELDEDDVDQAEVNLHLHFSQSIAQGFPFTFLS